jgi:hypothetical protein
MAIVKQNSRFLHHRLTTAGGQFTIPTSSDHTDETWASTDLHIGEIGLNVSDDTIFMRTNNGIVQIATGTGFGGPTVSVAQTIVFNTNQLQIGSTYSATSFVRNVNSYTDLGSTSLAWQDLYIGGTSSGLATINVNGGVHIKQASNVGILSSNYDPFNNSPLQIYATASATNHDRPLHLNSNNVYIGSGNEQASLASKSAIIQSSTNQVAVIGAADVTMYTGITCSVHLGYGYGKTNYESTSVTLGGKVGVRSIADDGSFQYLKSDWITSQAKLRTTNALSTTLVSIPWSSTASGGDVIQVKGYVIGTDISDPSLVYTVEIMGAYSINSDGSLTINEIGTPITNELSSWPATQPYVTMNADGSAVYIKAQGIGSNTIQWLCSYSYHRLISITV